MLSHNFSNLAVPMTITASMTNVQTTMQLNSLAGLPAYPYFLVIDRANSSIEVVQVTSLNAGTTVNVVRGYGDTSPILHTSGAEVLHMAPAEFFTEVLAAVNNAPVVMRFYDTPGGTTWNKPTDESFKGVIVELQGGGGGSGGTAATTSTQTSGSGGGKGGSYARFWVPAASLGSTETVTVGAAGAAGTAGGVNPTNKGGTGGTSSFGAHGSAVGGEGGSAGGAATPSWTHQDGGSLAQNFSGTATNVLFVRGADGGTGIRMAGTGALAVVPGYGGGSHLGGQQKVGTIVSNKITGSVGQAYGGGASGPANANVQSATAGAAGAAGCAVVTEFYG